MNPLINGNRNLKLLAREMRGEGVEAESLLWYYALKSRKMCGYQFHRRYPVGDSTVDFICLKLKLIIEIRGNTTLTKSLSDQKREEDLRRLGYIVLSFSDSEVLNRTDEVVEEIRDAVEVTGENLNLYHWKSN